MILYLDASALVKRYIQEAGSDRVTRGLGGAEVVGTSVVTRAEVSAALGKSARVGILEREEARAALQVFRSEWTSLVRIQATEPVVARADSIAWDLSLRGYDALQLASALAWQDGLERQVTLATFDRALKEAAEARGLTAFP